MEGPLLDDPSLLSSLLSHLNLSKWAWLFNVCPCFCVGEVLYFFTFHWLLLPLTFLWVTPHTAEPLWEFFPTLWSHNTTAWLQLCNIYEIPSTILKKNVSFQHLLSKFFLSNLVFLVNFLIYSSKGYVFFFMKFKTPSWFIRCAFIDTSFCFCFFFCTTISRKLLTSQNYLVWVSFPFLYNLKKTLANDL